MSLVQIEKRSGKSIRIGNYQITPLEKASRVQPPGMWGVLIWNRPSGVLVQHPDGTDEVIEIHDQTRRAQLGLLGLGLIGSILIMIISKLMQE